ncbi:MAG: hypothetical protein FD180_1604 [Planctomycetota bacterium]|nr:MAG: hypothetical protein FD180_1604 [Planctomycetota bacterium]
MKRFAILAFAAVLAGCASSPREDSSPEGEARSTGRSSGSERGLTRPEPVEISVDTGDRDLGAYTLTLVYDRMLVHVVAVEPTADFPAPFFTRRGFTSGELILSSLKVERYTRGRFVVARVAFESLGGDPSRLVVRLVTLVDSEGRPVKGRAEASRDRVP